MKQIIYSKYKFTENLFYKSGINARVEEHKDYFKVVMVQMMHYTGFYKIHSIVANSLGVLILKTIKCDSLEELENAELYDFNEYFISIHNNGKKFKIYRRDQSGIFLKN